jgi:hypothetical protein
MLHLKERTGWSDVLVEEFQELYELEREQPIDYLTERLSILLDIDVDDEEFQQQDVDFLFDLINKYKWLDSAPPEQPKKTIQLNGLSLKLKPLNEITVGEFIDLNHLLEEPIRNVHEIAAILYKQYRANEWGHEIEEPYTYNLKERSEAFLELPITEIYGLIYQFSNWKEWIHQQYTHIFIDPEDLEEDFERDNLSEAEQAEIERAIEVERREAQWSWEFLLLNITQDRFEQIDTVLNMTIIFFFNFYSVKQYRDKKQAKV